MPGTRKGGKKAAITNKQRYGDDFYGHIGRRGGKKSRGGGFAAHPELAAEAGRKGAIRSAEVRRERAAARREGTVHSDTSFGEFIARLRRLGERFS